MSAAQDRLVLVSDFGATLRCGACTIFIGIGHLEQEPQLVPGQPGQFCAACCRRLLRRPDEERAVLAVGRPVGAPDRERQPIVAARMMALG